MSERSFSLPLTLRLSSFHIGSAMIDILLATIWNRVMIFELGLPATPIALLLGLRYFLFPLSIWAGFRSDTKPIMGLQRTPYIWGGRALMFLGLPLLGLSTAQLTQDTSNIVGWILAILCCFLFGVGTLVSGSPYLALVRDSAPPAQQGLAVSIVLTALIIFFPISAIIYSIWMPEYHLATFEQMVWVTAVIAGIFWFISIVGVEKQIGKVTTPSSTDTRHYKNFTVTFKKVWADERTRGFFLFFAIATLSAWMHDAILEPFGADLFHIESGGTTDFSRIWLGMTAITLIGSNIFWRKRPSEQQSNIAIGGLSLMAVGMAFLAGSSFGQQEHMVQIALALFGAGFGFYSFGAFNLMSVMTTVAEAGAYLGMWTVVELLFKGAGTFLGGVFRDKFLEWFDSASVGYGLIFGIEAIGLAVGIVFLLQVDVLSWAQEMGKSVSPQPEQIPMAMDL